MLREAMAVDRADPAGVYFGTSTASCMAAPTKASRGGSSPRFLPPVWSVEAVSLCLRRQPAPPLTAGITWTIEPAPTGVSSVARLAVHEDVDVLADHRAGVAQSRAHPRPALLEPLDDLLDRSLPQRRTSLGRREERRAASAAGRPRPSSVGRLSVPREPAASSANGSNSSDRSTTVSQPMREPDPTVDSGSR